jgi:hypothetical protein
MLNYDDLDTYSLLISVCQQFAVSPGIPIESGMFFRQLLSEYTGPTDKKSVRAWLKEQVPLHFITLGSRPKWIQGAEWPFANGEPMIFVGEIDLDIDKRGLVTPTLYHDDTSLYVFVAPRVEPVVILQQY